MYINDPEGLYLKNVAIYPAASSLGSGCTAVLFASTTGSLTYEQNFSTEQTHILQAVTTTGTCNLEYDFDNAAPDTTAWTSNGVTIDTAQTPPVVKFAAG